MSQATDSLQVFIGYTPPAQTVTKAVPFAAGGLRGALSTGQPGNWSSDHRAESTKYVGWHYVAARAIALQASQATATVYDDRQSPPISSGFSSFKSIRAHYRRKHGSIWKAVAAAQNEEAVNVVPDEHPLAKLYRRPNPWQSGGMERYEMMLQLALTGVLLIWKVPNRAGRTVERYVVPTAVCEPLPPSKEMPNGGYRISPSAARAWATHNDPQGFVESRGFYRAIGARLPVEAFLSVRWPNPILKDDGQSPVSACALWSDCADMVDRARWAHLKNGANPSLMVTGPENSNMDEGELNALAARVNDKYAGADNTGKVLVTNHGTEAVILGTNPKDMVYDIGFLQMRDAILAIHGTPGIAAGITDGGSYAAFYASLKQFITLTVQPQLSLIAEEETVQQAAEFGEGFTVEYEAASIDDPTILEAALATDIGAQARTKNEHRAVRGLPPNPEWGDEIVGTPAAPKLDPNAMLGAGPAGVPGEPGDGSVAAGGKDDPFESKGGDSVQQGRGASAGLADRTLDKFQAGKITEARALATLRMLSLSSEAAAALIADAKDGSIDEPENKQAVEQANAAEAEGEGDAEKPDEPEGGDGGEETDKPKKKPSPFDNVHGHRNGNGKHKADDAEKNGKKKNRFGFPKSIRDRLNGSVSFAGRFSGNGHGEVDDWLAKAVAAVGRKRGQVKGMAMPSAPTAAKPAAPSTERYDKRDPFATAPKPGPSQFNEPGFQKWYAKHAASHGLDPNPDAPEHKYDYRGAYAAGVNPDPGPEGHWPSQFKQDDHPNRFIDGVDTRAEDTAGADPQTLWDAVKSISFTRGDSLIKNCGTGAGGFQPGNTCAKGTDGTGEEQQGGSDGPAGSAEAGELHERRSVSGSDGLVESPRASAAAKPLAGLPQKPITIEGHGTVTPAPFQPAREAAAAYAKAAGLPYNPPTEYAKVDKERATRIAAEYDKMPHDPNNPEVKAAYAALVKETVSQWKAVEATGLHVEFIPHGMPDPYAASPRLATEDVRTNNHLWVFPTSSGFGTNDAASDNPLLADTGIEINGHKAVANDLFRVVHDYFGHIKEGVGFRADGEENAWRSHSAMFSKEARRAMTTETRGQNSWVNFGPYGEANRNAASDETHYADQKVGLLPEWVMLEGSGHDEGEKVKAFSWRNTAGSLFKGCGANAPGGGGFQEGNTCARGGDERGATAVYEGKQFRTASERARLSIDQASDLMQERGYKIEPQQWKPGDKGTFYSVRDKDGNTSLVSSKEMRSFLATEDQDFSKYVDQERAAKSKGDDGESDHKKPNEDVILHAGKSSYKEIDAAISRGEKPSVKPAAVGEILAAMAKDRMNTDITELNIEGTLLFGGEGLGFPRASMPQLGDDPQKFYAAVLADHGVRTDRVNRIDPTVFMPVQKEISGGGAGHNYGKIVASGGDVPKAITVTRDRYIIDGHHTWAAGVAYRMSNDPNFKIAADVVQADHKEVLEWAHEFAQKNGIPYVNYQNKEVPPPARESGTYTPKVKSIGRPGPMYGMDD